MLSAQLAFAVGLAVSAAGGTDDGVLRGVVVNATRGGAPSAKTEVVLRVEVDRQFVPAAETVTDEQGRFEFTQLPLGTGYLYLPGANREEVHYPGPRVRLTPAQPSAAVRLEVCDVVRYPSPLVIERQDILIKPESGALRVTESLLIRNPTLTTYVGQAASAEATAWTLSLSIPPDFERTTFHQEFYGRNFALVDGKVATGIPWTPGQRDVTFTYTLRNEDRHRVWQRPLDLPCQQLRVRIQHNKPDEVACNLSRAAEGKPGEIVFDSQGKTLPAGHVICVELGRLPISWTRYGRWTALAVLIGLVAVAAVAARPRQGHPGPAVAAPRQSAAKPSPGPRRLQSRKQRRRAA